MGAAAHPLFWLADPVVRAARADLFLCSGALAEAPAGRMRQAGTLYLLLPRPRR